MGGKRYWFPLRNVKTMRIRNIKNKQIETDFADVGAGVEPLTDEEYDTFEKIVKRTKTPKTVHDFDDTSKWFMAKLPENKVAEERIMPDGNAMMSISFVLADNKWTNILVDPDAPEVEACNAHLGCNVAIVGNLSESKEGKFINIRGYRGMIILADETEDDDDIDID